MIARQITYIQPIKRNPTIRCASQPSDCFKADCLAGAVAPQKSDDFSRRNLKLNISKNYAAGCTHGKGFNRQMPVCGSSLLNREACQEVFHDAEVCTFELGWD